MCRRLFAPDDHQVVQEAALVSGHNPPRSEFPSSGHATADVTRISIFEPEQAERNSGDDSPAGRPAARSASPLAAPAEQAGAASPQRRSKDSFIAPTASDAALQSAARMHSAMETATATAERATAQMQAAAGAKRAL